MSQSMPPDADAERFMNPSQQSRSVMGNLVRHFGPGVLLIIAAATELLVSDPRRKHEQPVAGEKKVALFNYASVPVLEDGQAGMIAGLKEGGFVDGKNVTLKHYNAEGDRSTAIMIAKEVVSGQFDAVLTL